MNASRRVRFEYCISLIFVTWRRESDVIALEPHQSAWFASLPYCLITFFLGWWGVPSGILLTPVVLWNNLNGGREIERSEPAAQARD